MGPLAGKSNGKARRTRLNRALNLASRIMLDRGNEKDLLRRLHKTEGLALSEIADLFGVTPQAVGYALRRHGLAANPRGRRSEFHRHLENLGFKTSADYFKARAEASFEKMASELGVATDTVRRHYGQFVQQVKADQTPSRR
jgi:hypothetical protein